MTHLPFIAGAYAATIGVFLILSVSAALRLRAAERRLHAVETRRERVRA
ncbi:heme exporter protein CcmD [Acetobacteraceae bacterium KSS8]|uniref:Heme exporter protein D n=1 Tax=Endosaccharibacter trunci TaxID=2812733 RepID=A0ABT1W233_9PROT|nr:heme exporter protein CcmD [Acetobacteraceae bacterium KSS8]